MSDQQQPAFFNRVMSDPAEGRPRWASPHDRAAYESRTSLMREGRTIRNRSISLTDIVNVPVEQRRSAQMDEDEWRRYMQNEILWAWKPVLQKHKTIFSVPRALFEVRPRCYCPRLVTVGPLCRKLEPLPMDACKALCVKQFLERKGMRLAELMDQLVPDPDNLRNVYFGLPRYNTETIKLLLTVDTIFIYEYLLCMSKDFDADDEVCGYMVAFINNQITVTQVTRDLFLTGNQLPISFLKKCTELPNCELGLDDLLLCLEFLIFLSNPFCTSHPGSTTLHRDLKELTKGIPLLECEHILDCLYVACVRHLDDDDPQVFSKPASRLPRASELKKVGIKFKARKGNTAVVKYHKKSLKFVLPKLSIYDETEDIFRNLVAYELTNKAGGEFCGYALLMDSLIDTSEDLSILYRADVLENHLGSDERLLRMWNDMCINISENSAERWEIMTREILMHYKSHWRVMYVEFHSKFLSRPWLWISTIAAGLLLIMSALQTIYTVAGFYKS